MEELGNVSDVTEVSSVWLLFVLTLMYAHGTFLLWCHNNLRYTHEQNHFDLLSHFESHIKFNLCLNCLRLFWLNNNDVDRAHSTGFPAAGFSQREIPLTHLTASWVLLSGRELRGLELCQVQLRKLNSPLLSLWCPPPNNIAYNVNYCFYALWLWLWFLWWKWQKKANLVSRRLKKKHHQDCFLSLHTDGHDVEVTAVLYSGKSNRVVTRKKAQFTLSDKNRRRQMIDTLYILNNSRWRGYGMSDTIWQWDVVLPQ